ncbi:hypothetical protein OIO90_000640 [Microbotryomycetes sp. JL221]|nr:hypothetical protein OIO90_000640 [Microbotryomycetes sp. JL221]
MLDIVRDSSLGQLLNWASRGRVLPYADQRKDYIIPSKYLKVGSDSSHQTSRNSTPRNDSETLVEDEQAHEAKKGHSDQCLGEKVDSVKKYQFLVEFDKDDPDRPLRFGKQPAKQKLSELEIGREASEFLLVSRSHC